jgi:protein phosphatase
MNDPDTQDKDKFSLQFLRGVVGSDVGMCREENQDSYGVIEGENFRFFLVADGMGGVSGGAIASQLAVATLRECFAGKSTVDNKDIREAVELANQRIFIRGVEEPALAGMGTTLVGCCFSESAVYIVNVGDSRAYWIHDGSIRQLTDDHTLVMELLRSGAISEEQAHHSPVSHMLTRSLGPSTEVSVDCVLFSDTITAGDRFLLCSDGLYNLVREDEIFSETNGLNLEEAVPALIQLANARGGTDNITIILIEVGSEVRRYGTKTTENRISQDSERPTARIERKELACPTTSIDKADSECRDASVNIISANLSLDALSKIQAGNVSVMANTPADVVSPAALVVANDGQQLFTKGFVTALAGSFAVAGVLTFVVLGQTLNGPKIIASAVDSVAPVQEKAAMSHPLTANETVHSLAPPPGAAEAPDFDRLLLVSRDSFDSSDPNNMYSASGPQNEFALESSHQISRRKEEVRSVIKRIQRHLAAIEQPLQGSIWEEAATAKERVRIAEVEVGRLEAEVEAAMGTLAQWRAKKNRLSDETLVSIADEIADSARAVQDRKDDFERTTFQYLKTVDAQQAEPNAPEMKERLDRALELRNAALANLRESVTREIDGHIGVTQKRLASNLKKRDLAQVELRLAKEGLEVIHTILKGNTDERAKLKVELEENLRAARQELAEVIELEADRDVMVQSENATDPRHD